MPKGIRPTQDKVRKALFDILGDIEGLSFLELFSGSGAVGLEALSRGAKEAILVEYNRDCIAVIEKNIELLKVRNCSLFPYEAQKAIDKFLRDKRKFDVIFLDPPYLKSKNLVTDTLAKKILQSLSSCDILSPHGLIVVQHSKNENLPALVGSLILCKQSQYADTFLSFYKKKGS